VLDRSRARQLVRKWKKQRKELQEQREAKLKQIERCQRELTRLGVLGEQMLRRYTELAEANRAEED